MNNFKMILTKVKQKMKNSIKKLCKQMKTKSILRISDRKINNNVKIEQRNRKKYTNKKSKITQKSTAATNTEKKYKVY